MPATAAQRRPVRVISAAEVTREDLRRLVLWSDTWTPDRYEATAPDSLWENISAPDQPIPAGRPWTRALWVGDRWEVVVLLRSYLRLHRHHHTVVWDNAVEPAPGYVILTDHP